MNGITHVVYKINRNVIASDPEAELGSLFVNAQDAAPIRTTLIDMNHPKPPTSIQLDNLNLVGISK